MKSIDPQAEMLAAFDRGLAKFKQKSLEERRAFLVEIGLTHPDGSLTPRYGGKPLRTKRQSNKTSASTATKTPAAAK